MLNIRSYFFSFLIVLNPLLSSAIFSRKDDIEAAANISMVGKIKESVESFFVIIKNMLVNISISLGMLDLGVLENSSFLFKCFLAFLAGLSVSLTPCIYPLIPITIGIISSSKTISFAEQLWRLLYYLLGVCSVFSVMGFLAIKLNWIFGSWLASPIFAIPLFLFLAGLGLSMFDWFDIDFNIVNFEKIKVSSGFSAFVFGCATGLATSPCMTPALFSLLSFISQQNNLVEGLFLLFFFAFGLTSLIFLFSFYSSSFLHGPKPGAWMVEVKRGLGFAIFFLALTFIQPISSRWMYSFIQALIFLIMAVYYYTSVKKDIVISVLKERENIGHAKEEFYVSVWHAFNFMQFIKSCVAIFSLLGFIYCFGKGYLIFNRTTLRRFLIRNIK